MERGHILLQGRDRLLNLRASRENLERTRELPNSQPLRQATQSAAIKLVEEVLNEEAVKAQVQQMRAEYAAKHGPSKMMPRERATAPPQRHRNRISQRVCRQGRFSENEVVEEDEETRLQKSCRSPVDDVAAARQFFELSGSSSDESSPVPFVATQLPLLGSELKYLTDNTVLEAPDRAQFEKSKDSQFEKPDEAQFGIRESAHFGIPDSKHFENSDDVNLDIPENYGNCSDGVLNGFPSRWSSWKQFHDGLKSFSAQTNQCFIIRSSQTVKKRNMQMNDGIRHFPIAWKHYFKTLVCTHGHKQRPRGKGIRVHRSVRYTGCTAKVHALLSSMGTRHYIYVRSSGTHNHNLSSTLWDYYAANRTIQDPALLATVSDMRAAGSSPKGILAWIRKQTGYLRRG